MRPRNSLEKHGRITLMCSVLLLVGSLAVPAQEGPPTRKGTLIMVGDATLSYASYSFELPPGWIPAISAQVLRKTHETGFWMGRRADSNTMLQINPNKKDRMEGFGSLEDFVKAARELNTTTAHCSPDAMAEYPMFTPSLRYPYQVQMLSNCPPSTYGLVVFVELPEHVVMFNLYGKGADERCITAYLKELEQVLTTFTWTLGQ